MEQCRCSAGGSGSTEMRAMTVVSPDRGSAISTQARGVLRRLWVDLEARSAKMVSASEAVPKELLRSLKHKGAVGADRARFRIISAMPERPIHVDTRQVLWRILVPHDDHISVEALGVGLYGSGAFRQENFGLSITKHALGRLLDRSRFTCDPVTAMLSAHDALLALQHDEGRRVYALPTVTLPAGDGVFLATPRTPTPENDDPFAVCRTWIASSQLWDDQEADVALWDSLRSLEAPASRKSTIRRSAFA